VGQKILKREIKVAKDTDKGQKIVEKAYKKASDKRIVVMEEALPYEFVLNKYPEPLLVVFPNSEGDWRAKAVRDDPRSFVDRVNFPESWAGLRSEELARVSGVSDAIFCHNKRFMSVAKTREGAIKLANIAIGENI
jgi:uncharacterized UPF0160 family protein